ncbi:MAG: hypothetical protein IH849_06115 [Acidobacteria bacterium]|nr:hypothetical protein [Acidobacteriota bacterium]
MGRTRGKAVILFALLAGATVGAASIDSATIAAPGEAAAATFLGFEIGEERRYVIAPEGAMRDGESATWSTRLDRVEAAEGRSIGVFELTHSESRQGLGLAGTMLVKWNYRGEARINEFGFPEEVRFSMYEEHIGEAPWRGVLMSAAYTLDGDGYIKTVRVPNQEWQFTFGVATHDDLDLDVPSGMFLFRPQAAGIDFFMNPALLGFAVPELVPDTWKQRVLFFRPTYPVRFPGARYVANERNRVAAIRRYYAKRTLEAKESSELQIGGRTLNVRKIDVTGTARAAFVDEFGRVVRIDLDPDPITRRDRYIRILFPSEY